MKRGWKKSVDRLARDMVSSIMNDELIEIVRGSRDLTDDRLDWLADFGANQAMLIYTTNENFKYAGTYFKNRALHHGKLYAKVIKEQNSSKEVK